MRAPTVLLPLLLPLAATAEEASEPLVVERPEVEVAAHVRDDLDGLPVAEVGWTGANVTRRFVIARELHVREGEPFRVETLRDDVVRLENLGVFARIDVTTSRSPDGVHVRYVFREMPSYIPYLAFAYTEENGWSVGPALSSVNLFGRAMSVVGRAVFGGTNTFNLNVRHPWITGNHVSLDLATSYLVRTDEIREFEEKSTEVTPWVGRFLGRNGRIAGTVSYFRMEADRPWVTLSPGPDEWGRIGLRIGYDSRDSWVVTRRGWWTELEWMKHGGFMGGDADFTSVTADVRRFLPLGRGASVTLGGLTTLRTGRPDVDVPVYMDFRMGGANSIRGYDVDKLGRELFGKNQLIVTAECRYPLIPVREWPVLKWAFRGGLDLAVFVDTGTAWSDDADFTGDRFRTGGGFGLRLVGLANEMVRVDFGFGDETFLLHFGPWSKFTAQRNRLR